MSRDFSKLVCHFILDDCNIWYRCLYRKFLVFATTQKESPKRRTPFENLKDGYLLFKHHVIFEFCLLMCTITEESNYRNGVLYSSKHPWSLLNLSFMLHNSGYIICLYLYLVVPHLAAKQCMPFPAKLKVLWGWVPFGMCTVNSIQSMHDACCMHRVLCVTPRSPSQRSFQRIFILSEKFRYSNQKFQNRLSTQSFRKYSPKFVREELCVFNIWSEA